MRFEVENMVKKGKKKGDRSTTSLVIDKEDLKLFNELRARETGRRGVSVTQSKFIKFLLDLYKVVAEKDEAMLESAESKGGI